MTKKPVRRERPAEDPPVSYLFEIGAMDLQYSFGLAPRRDSERFYTEIFHVSATATGLAPARFAGRPITVYFMAKDGIIEEGPSKHDPDWRPTGVGFIETRGDRTVFTLTVPTASLWEIVASIRAGDLRYVHGYGARVRRSVAILRSIGLGGTYEAGECDL